MKLLKGHNHDVGRYGGIWKCDACDDLSYTSSLNCDDCDFTVHDKCNFVFSTLETFEHRSHVGNCLMLLTTGAPDHTDPKCHICGKNTKRLLYHCSMSDLNVDNDCVVDDMCARVNMNMPWYHHPLLKLVFGYQMGCKVCGHPDGFGYFCPLCRLMVHDNCVSVFEKYEITRPLDSKHSLKLLTQGAPDYTKPDCHVCGRPTDQDFLYHCDICKFNIDMVCDIKYNIWHTHIPVLLSNTNSKVYEHKLMTLVPRLITLICDACGTQGDRSPYVSLHKRNLMSSIKSVLAYHMLYT